MLSRKVVPDVSFLHRFKAAFFFSLFSNAPQQGSSARVAPAHARLCRSRYQHAQQRQYLRGTRRELGEGRPGASTDSTPYIFVYGNDPNRSSKRWPRLEFPLAVVVGGLEARRQRKPCATALRALCLDICLHSVRGVLVSDCPRGV